MIQCVDKETGKPYWSAFPRQQAALERTEFEILFGGARGGGKTDAGIVFLLMGNPTGDIRRAATTSYVNHAAYRALILRKNAVDMGYWIDHAKRIYGPLGAQYNERPAEFRWPSGAKFIIGHLAEDEAYEKYQGPEYQRILIEELTQVPSLDLYLKLFGCCRSVHKELRRQIFLTTNPGGPGHNWVRERFVEPRRPDGSICPPMETYTDPQTGLTRVFIPSRVQDNPMYANDTQYIAQLRSLPPAVRRAWLEGDWHAIAGVYFEEFRPEGPVAGEPPEARHVVESAELLPWWPRWLACDWGYSHNSACYKACLAPNGQIFVYDEMVMNRTTPDELGSQIGKWAQSEVENAPERNITLWLSPDAFSKKTDEKTIAHQIAAGIATVLGTDSVYIPEFGEFGTGDLLARKELQSTASITIRRAPNQRVAGWQFIHSLMRWWPTVKPSGVKFDPAEAARLMQHPNGMKLYAQYMRMFSKEPEVLPRLQIIGCPRLVDAIPKARANDPDKGDPEDIDKKHFEGMDSLDALRYLVFAYKVHPIQEPFDAFFHKHMEKHSAGVDPDPNSRVWMARKAEEDWRKQNEAMGSFNIIRHSSRRRRSAQA